MSNVIRLASFRPGASASRNDPIPDVDERDRRRAAWRKASVTTDFHYAIHELSVAAMLGAHVGVDGAQSIGAMLGEDRRGIFIAEARKAEVEQLRLPAPDAAALNWKVNRLRKLNLPIGKAELESLIAADEAYLAPRKRKRRRS